MEIGSLRKKKIEDGRDLNIFIGQGEESIREGKNIGKKG